MDKNLLCAESFYPDKMAEKDTAILDDDRVLDQLLQTEFLYMPKRNPEINDLDPNTRKIVMKWMLEVSEAEQCPGPVFPLATNIFDRFVSKCDVPKKFLQLIACDCLLIASKIRHSWPIAVQSLCYYSDDSVTPCQVRKFETLVVSKLHWDLAAVTAFDYVDQILQRVTWCSSRQEKIVRVHSNTLINLCCTENEFFGLKPSIIAAASIMSAMAGIRIKIDAERSQFLCSLIKADTCEVEGIASKIEKKVCEEMALLKQPVSKMIDSHIYETLYVKNSKNPESPTDVQNVDF